MFRGFIEFCRSVGCDSKFLELRIRPNVSGTTLKRNGKAWNDVLLHHRIGKRSEQKNAVSKRCSSHVLIVKALLTKNLYLRE
ncbi:hypothetical protein TNCV_976441 [Trichonephila clavipes]|nr:hypothetical protein TNCV_976441 [Trichonephila clavipes]